MVVVCVGGWRARRKEKHGREGACQTDILLDVVAFDARENSGGRRSPFGFSGKEEVGHQVRSALALQDDAPGAEARQAPQLTRATRVQLAEGG